MAESIADMIIRHEGSVKQNSRHVVYDDSNGGPVTRGMHLRGFPTIGYGRLVSGGRGLSENEARLLLLNDIAEVLNTLQRNVPYWVDLPDAAQRGLIDMCFNLGWPQLNCFTRMWAALEAGDYEGAANEALDSRWATQVGNRAIEVADLFRSCA